MNYYVTIICYEWHFHIQNMSSGIAEKPSLKASESTCKQNTQFFTSEKLIDLFVIFFLFT